MAQYTQHYGLHQWEPGDSFLRTEFNEDLAKIDGAIKGVETQADAKLAGKADAAGLAALRAVVDGKAEVVLGSYTGNGDTQEILLGFRPRAVVVPAGTYYNVIAIDGSSNSMLSITDKGFSVNYRSGAGTNINGAKGVYHYIALR